MRLRYRESRRAEAPYHDQVGVVVIVGRGRPRNHAIRLETGAVVIVPCGQLVPCD